MIRLILGFLLTLSAGEQTTWLQILWQGGAGLLLMFWGASYVRREVERQED